MSRSLLSHAVRSAAVGLAITLAVPCQASPLFAGSSVFRIRIEAPVQRIMRTAVSSTDPHEGQLSLTDTGERHSVRISARGLSRRRRESCRFPPLRVEFITPPAVGTLFHGQRKLKLVTHCRAQDSFQRHVLLEYAAYRLLNVLTPRSFRVRLAQIDYVETGRAEPMLSRYGFFIEDVDDMARRNGLREAETGDIAPSRLSAADSARVAIFQYMIGSIDWSANRGPPGSACCHNVKLVGSRSDPASALVPVPYDFDQSGLVDVPYAVVPPQLRLRSVRERRYRGYCIHQAQAQEAAAELRAARPALEQALSEIPVMEAGTRRTALNYLADFFEDVATPQRVTERMLGHCLGPAPS